MAEFNTKPKAVIVHDPTLHGSFREFDLIDDVQSELLFREKPNESTFSQQYSFFIETLSSVCEKTIRLDSLIEYNLIDDIKVNPNQIYTRDSAITLPWHPGYYIQCKMGHRARENEPTTMSHALNALGLKQLAVIANGYLEGGDVIPFSHDERRSLIIGYGPRTTINAVTYLSKKLIPACLDEIIAIQLADFRINLDGGMVPITEDVMIMHRESIVRTTVINSKGTHEINFENFAQDLGYIVIPVTFEESRYQQACNCFCTGGREVIMYDLCPRVAAECAKLSVQVHMVPGSELVKGTGGPRCMTRPIY